MSDEESAFERWEEEKQIERFERFMADMTARFESDALEAAEESLSATRSTLLNDCPVPLEWHPFYRGKTFLIDWLNDDPKCGLPLDTIRLPVARSVHARMIMGDNPMEIEAPLPSIIMRKRRAAGPAPYVGRPFVYGWNIGEDDLGRCIAGESRIFYTNRPMAVES